MVEKKGEAYMLAGGCYGLVEEAETDLTGQLREQLFFKLIGRLCGSV
jgi:hypothetical protein